MEKFFNLKRIPDAVISFNDYVHLHAVEWAYKNNIKINKDVYFASFANISMNRYMTHPPCVSIDQSPYEQGKLAMEMMIDVLNSEKNKNYTQEVQPKLIGMLIK